MQWLHRLFHAFGMFIEVRRIRRFRSRLPEDFKFDRDVAHQR
jgi:hypothetical protein